MKRFIVFGCAFVLLTGCGNKINSVKTVVESRIEDIEQAKLRKEDADIISTVIDLSNRNLWDNIVKKGIKVNGYKKSTFRYAWEKGTMDFSYYLIDHGMDINYVDKDGKTELMYLCKWLYLPAYEKVITKLIQNGCDVNAQDNSGHTALENVILDAEKSNGNNTEEYMEIKMLFEQGAELREETISLICNSHFSYYTSLKELSKEAISGKFGKVLPQNCIEAAFLNNTNYLNDNLIRNGMTETDASMVAFYVSSLGQSEQLEKVLQVLQVPLNSIDIKGNTLLMAAAATGNQETFFYLEDKISHNVVNKNSETLLTAAIAGGNSEIIDYVFHHDLDMWNYNSISGDETYERSLQLMNTLSFCKNGKFFIEYLDSVELSDDELEELCVQLILKDNLAFLDILLGTSNIKALFNDAGRCEYILGYCYTPEQVKSFLPFIPDGVKKKLSPTLTHILGRKYVILDDPVAIIKEFVDAGVDVNAADTPIPPIWEAVGAGDVESVKELINQKADVNAIRKSSGSSPLIMASMGDMEMMELLLQNGAEVNYETEDGYTALRVAVGWSNTEGVKLLLEHGADKTIVPPDSPSLYDIAKKKGDKEIMEMLKD